MVIFTFGIRDPFPRTSVNVSMRFSVGASERTHALVREISALLRLSPDQVARGVVNLGDSGSFSKLLDRATAIRHHGTGHLTLLGIGGSASTGADLASLDDVFSSVFGRALSRALGVPVVVLNMAVGATATDFYSVCVAQHLSPQVDIVFTENALNDLSTVIGPRIYAPYEAAVVQQLILSVKSVSPHAVFVYAGLQPSAMSCESGEDLPHLRDVYALYNVSFVSVRDLVFGPRSTWGGECSADIEDPFLWREMFPVPNFITHPSKIVHEYLALLILKVFGDQFRDISRRSRKAILADEGKSAIRPLLDPFPFPGRPFECRSTLSPRFGAPLVPLPSPGCEVLLNSSGGPKLVGTCGSVQLAELWSDAVSTIPVSNLDLSRFPAVDNWAISEQKTSFMETVFNTTAASRVRQDRKISWEAAGSGAPITFIIRVGAAGMIGLGYFGGGGNLAATFSVTNALGEMRSTTVDQLISFRHTRTAILFRDLTPGWWRLQATPHGPFSICAIATA